MDPVGSDGKPQLGKKKLIKVKSKTTLSFPRYRTKSFSFSQGEKTFFLQPGERLAKGIQDVYVLEEDEGLILRCTETFKEDGVSRLSRRKIETLLSASFSEHSAKSR